MTDIPGTEKMKAGMVVSRGGGSMFIELPYYVGYLGTKCWRCGVTNTTFEVYRYEVGTNCLSCSRGEHALTDRAKEIAAAVRRGENPNESA